MFSRKIGRRSSNCFLYVDAACFTYISFCVVSQVGIYAVESLVVTFNFYWDIYLKKGATMLVGTSTELELALFTLCYKTRPGKNCHVSFGKKELTIKTVISGKRRSLLSAFFLK